MAPPFRLRPVLEGSPRMEDRVVVTELHVSKLQIHVEVNIGVVGQAVEEIQRRLLQWFERFSFFTHAALI